MAVVQDPGLVERGGRGHVVGNARARGVGTFGGLVPSADMTYSLIWRCVSWSLIYCAVNPLCLRDMRRRTSSWSMD